MLKLLQLCLTLCDPMDHSLPGSSVHGILQAWILECVAMPSSRESSWPRHGIHVSFVACTAGGFFTNKPLEKPLGYDNLMVLCLGECILLCLLSFLDVCICDFPWILKVISIISSNNLSSFSLSLFSFCSSDWVIDLS